MKKLKEIILFAAILFTTCCILPSAKAQGPGFPDEPEDNPIDGGATAVMIAAACYGAKKIRDRRRK